jgi:DnaK suppressor protein
MKAKYEKRLEHEKEKLRQEIAETRAEIDRLRGYLKIEVDPSADEGDPDFYEREKNLALVQSLEHKVESLEWALRLAEQGIYGTCERCGQRIDPARLEIMPEATLCVECKTELERGARRKTQARARL